MKKHTPANQLFHHSNPKTYRLSALLLVLAILSISLGTSRQNPQTPYTGLGDSATLNGLYQRWKTSHEARSDRESMQIRVAYSKTSSAAANLGKGVVSINLIDGRLSAAIDGLPESGDYQLWLLNNQQRGGGQPDAINLGQLQRVGDHHRLTLALNRELMQDFTVDAAAIAEAGDNPRTHALLSGSPGLLQRLYFSERALPLTNVSAVSAPRSEDAGGFSFLLPKPAYAAKSTTQTPEQQLAALIATGQRLFTEETFAGNGRTCSTCHRPDNNHTIDPAYIATLPANDPLFVAEYNSQLAELEKPALIRQFGLFSANIDGFDRPPVERSASQLLGIGQSLVFETTELGGEFSQDTDYYATHNPIAEAGNRETQAIGWSADGAPDGGSLRDFAKGAIKQHMTQSLNRVENVDFRMPSEDELDALEAYILSLGRSQDINLAAMTFKSPIVQRGKLLFDTKQNPIDSESGLPIFGTTANCNGCHMNAGAISSTTGGNPTRDTGIERMRDQPHHLVDPNVAYDGGFGQQQQDDCGPDQDQTCYSDDSVVPQKDGLPLTAGKHLHRFSTPSLIEAADTAPFFHNHSISTLEEAVAFYNTEAFNNSLGAFTSSAKNRQVKLDSSQVVAVAMFLRSINVLENIRSSNQMDQKAIDYKGKTSNNAVKLALADTEDAVQVLQQAVINPYPEALNKLQKALDYEKKALKRLNFGNQRKKLLNAAMALKLEAKALIVDGG
ncbi:hypothetical protein [Methylomonas sp. HYX-M1]|uniref:hypothetical protein n=1 Tax=Methylomonas sp. HYX-M1 TaxID=3139307 RepID=UPI00345B5F75